MAVRAPGGQSGKTVDRRALSVQNTNRRIKRERMICVSEELKGKLINIQGFSVQDGPGIRTTVFFKGCPLRCPWCHSPESQAFYPQLSWMSQKCLGTEHCRDSCIQACPKHAVSYGKIVENSAGEPVQHVTIDRAVCDNCGDCAERCYPEALFICGKDYTVEEVMKIVRRDLPFYAESGGGMTISGGECLSQPEFALALLKAAKAEGIHTAVDTSGFAPWKTVEAVLPYTDLFLYDLKHMDSAAHKAATGVPNEIILENAEKIAQAGGKLQIRIPVIPRFNNDPENIRRTGEFCRELGAAVELIQLLPYHSMGTMKYFRLDENAKVMEAVPPSDAEMERHKAALQEMGLPVTIH